MIHFSRSDGVLIEQRPEAKRFSGNGVIYVGRSVSLLINVDRTLDDQARDLGVCPA